ncbi:MAG: CPBP family intramembrane glutamic endopeptidase [Eudoraea sp.]|uniref:CPBP family intramembrane glutamic endopeptidase n=2 Tax=Eudoraea sp. TaxID=1979955 RepID=UPI003C754195
MFGLQKYALAKSPDKNPNVWARIFAIIISYIIVGGMFQLVGGSLMGIDVTNRDLQKSTSQFFLLIFFGFLGTFLAFYLFIKYVDKEAFVQLGFKSYNYKREVVLGILMGLASMGIGSLVLAFFNQLIFVKILLLPSEVFLTIILYLLVAIMEEVLFRGYILRKLMRAIDIHWALIISSMIFALMHAMNPHATWIGLANIFLSGILLGLGFIYTKNLWFPIALHFSWNLFQSFFGFNVSGEDTYTIIEWNRLENNIFNGGDFGFEGSVLCLVIQVFLILMVAYFFNQKCPKTDRSS